MKPVNDTWKTAIEVKREKNPDLGGDTYWVRSTRWPDKFVALCWRKRKVGGHCAAPAGRGTLHPGVGPCKVHEKKTGSIAALEKLSTGKQAKMTRRSLKYRLDKFIEEDQKDLFDLTKELGLQRLLLEDMLDEYETLDEDKVGVARHRMNEHIASIRQTVEGISKIQSRNALTAAHVAYLRMTVADIFIKFIDDPKKRELAIKTLVSRIAGGEAGDDTKIIKIAQEL